jgi:hypothetical protein
MSYLQVLNGQAGWIMVFSQTSFSNIAVGAQLAVYAPSRHEGTFQLADSAGVTIYWTAYVKNKTFAYSEISEVKFGTKNENYLKSDGSIGVSPSARDKL